MPKGKITFTVLGLLLLVATFSRAEEIPAEKKVYYLYLEARIFAGLDSASFIPKPIIEGVTDVCARRYDGGIPVDLFKKTQGFPIDYEKAIVLYEQIIKNYPNTYMPSPRLRGRNISSSGPAIPLLEHLVNEEINPLFQKHFDEEKYPNRYVDLATVEMVFCYQKLAEVEKDSKKKAENEKKAYELLEGLVKKYEKGHYEKEDAEFRKKIYDSRAFLRPEETALYLLAQADKKQKDYEKAIKRFREIITRYPTCQLAYISFDQINSIYEEHKKYEEAVKTLEEKWQHIEKHWPVYLGGKVAEDEKTAAEIDSPIYSKKKLEEENSAKIKKLKTKQKESEEPEKK